MGALLMLSVGFFVTTTLSMAPPTSVFFSPAPLPMPLSSPPPSPIYNSLLAVTPSQIGLGLSIQVVIGPGRTQRALLAAVALLDVGAITPGMEPRATIKDPAITCITLGPILSLAGATSWPQGHIVPSSHMSGSGALRLVPRQGPDACVPAFTSSFLCLASARSASRRCLSSTAFCLFSSAARFCSSCFLFLSSFPFLFLSRFCSRYILRRLLLLFLFCLITPYV